MIVLSVFCFLSSKNVYAEDYYTNGYGVTFDRSQYDFFTEFFYDGYQALMTQAMFDEYDGFDFIPKPFDFPRKSVIAIRNEKYYVVALDGSGKVLTEEPYDYIRLIMYYHMGSPYVYRKNGLKAWGLMNTAGEEICDNIIDRFAEGVNSVWYESGDKMGFWQFHTVFLAPIYDNIEMPGELEDPLLFTLNGIQGYVKFDRTFIPLSDYNNMNEIEQDEHRGDFVCEQYDID